MNFPLDGTNVEIVAPFDMIQAEAVVFQDSDDIMVRPVKNAMRHSALHSGKSVIPNLNGRRDRFVSRELIPKVEILCIRFLIERSGA